MTKVIYSITQDDDIPNLLVNEIPTCDLTLQRDIEYEFHTDLDLTLTSDRSPNRLSQLIDSSREVYLFNSEILTTDNTLLVYYYPFTLDVFDGIAVTQLQNLDETFLRDFPVRDLLTNRKIQGALSGASAFVTALATSAGEGLPNILLRLEQQNGTFIEGEDLIIDGISRENVEQSVNDYLVRLNVDNPEIVTNIRNNIQSMYRVGAQYQKECDTYTYFESFPKVNLEGIDTYNVQANIAQNCLNASSEKITLQYTPQLLSAYRLESLAEFGAEDYNAIKEFPLVNILRGQMIRGWQSLSEALVSDIEIKNVGGKFYVVATLSNATGDFLPQEPIEISSLTEGEVYNEWTRLYSQFPYDKFFDVLKSFSRRPFYTATFNDNLIYTGEMEQILKDQNKSLEVCVNGKIIPKEDYELEAVRLNPYVIPCEISTSYFPEEDVIYKLKFSNDYEIGAHVDIVTSKMDYLTKIDQGYSLIVDPDSKERVVYLGDCGGLIEPIAFHIENKSLSSLEYEVERMISPEMKAEYPNFLSFMKLYGEYSSLPTKQNYVFDNLDNIRSFDTIPRDYLPYRAGETLGPFSIVDEMVYSRSTQKEFNAFWNNNGTKRATEFMFKSAFNKDAKVKSLFCDKNFTTSLMSGVRRVFALITLEGDVTELSEMKTWDNIKLEETSEIVGSNGFYALIEGYHKNVDQNGTNSLLLELSHISGDPLTAKTLKLSSEGREGVLGMVRHINPSMALHGDKIEVSIDILPMKVMKFSDDATLNGIGVNNDHIVVNTIDNPIATNYTLSDNWYTTVEYRNRYAADATSSYSSIQDNVIGNPNTIEICVDMDQRDFYDMYESTTKEAGTYTIVNRPFEQKMGCETPLMLNDFCDPISQVMFVDFEAS